MFIIHDPVINKYTREKGEIIDVSEKWGWYVVKYKSGHVRRYDYLDTDNKLACMIDLGE